MSSIRAVPTAGSEFYQPASMAARIMTLLRPECRSAGEQRRFEQFPFPHDALAELAALLCQAGPECTDLYQTLRNSPVLSADELSNLGGRLLTGLDRCEKTQQDLTEKMERLLFRPVCFEQVWAEELEDVEKVRRTRCDPGGAFTGETVHERAHNARLCGLSLSGGGVRSATFNLGLLQGMAKHGVLGTVDYLSTVSGGGYIGGWLTAWIKRRSFAEVEKNLSDETRDPRCPELQPISFLRDYSSYLTPESGFFSADTWTAGTTWLRNTLLNLIVLLSGLAALLLIPRLLKALIETSTLRLGAFGHAPEELLTLIAVGCQIVIIIRVTRNLKLFGHTGPGCADGPNLAPGFGDPPCRIQKLIVVPAFLAAWFCSGRLWSLAREGSQEFIHTAGIGVMLMFCFALLVYLQVRGGFVACYVRETRRTVWNRRTARFLCFLLPLITTAVKAGLLWAVCALFTRWHRHNQYSFNTHVAVWGVPLVLADFCVCITLHIGLMGRNLPDDRREWWSRVAAYIGIYAVAVSALFSAACYAPWVVERASSYPPLRWGAIGSWALTTGAGVIAARLTGHKKKDTESARSAGMIRAIAVGAPYVFMIGLIGGVSTALHRLMLAIQQALTPGGCAAGNTFVQIECISPGVEIGFFAALSFVALYMSRTVDINEFSMHHFYRNRLIRAYLGASHCADRKPNRLTGFDISDDILLASLRPDCEPGLRDPQTSYDGPYPIFNAALNLVHGDRLSWQERKATSFIFSPKFCGYDYLSKAGGRAEAPLHNAGYRPSSAYAYPDGGIHLGTAMAISGAAASPNSGLHTSTAMAFLLTVFNVRLGWWMGNPRHDESWRRSGPRHGLMYLVRELFGMANDRQKHIYLSDGGHFENLGIYELVRRRCSLIVACDAEEDHAFSFTGLGGVIRKCFVDFGVRIDIDVSQIRPETGERYSTEHWAQGLIHYPEGWTGTLIYIKSSLTRDEPADLQAYLAAHDGFPHQSTADQFFNESQFESYHRLGLHIAKDVFGAWQPAICEWKRSPGAGETQAQTMAATSGL